MSPGSANNQQIIPVVDNKVVAATETTPTVHISDPELAKMVNESQAAMLMHTTPMAKCPAAGQKYTEVGHQNRNGQVQQQAGTAQNKAAATAEVGAQTGDEWTVVMRSPTKKNAAPGVKN
ncbi:hypothetical protein A4A49_36022 [Nicotiana attenuata]|uniref:Uncharacterized protein n=1 Tax=Nicotiana attenuata TaxID=49451 RepID=A0A1J6IEU2_NICAT|nr:hypothetical protein A4A49_36022 [Nicotiana attenuata]